MALNVIKIDSNKITTFVNYFSPDNKNVVYQPVLLTYRYGNDPFV